MANEPLIVIKPGQGLENGVFPSVEATVGTTWRTALNAWFRKTSVDHSLGTELRIPVIGRKPRAIAQANVNGVPRLYYEDLGIIWRWENGSRFTVGSLSSQGKYDLEPFGTWLIATDNVNQLKLWKNTGSFIDIGSPNFTRARIIKKLAERVIVYNTDELPSGMHWSAPSNPELWTPAQGNGAGFLPFRNLNSEIIAVADLGGSHAVYTKESMLVVTYQGAALQFGAPSQALTSIGAAGPDAIISRGQDNFGIFQGGIFQTNGSSFQMVDNPAVDEWVKSNVNWALGEEIIGFYDERKALLLWSLPLLDNSVVALSLDPMSGKFSYEDLPFRASIERDVFQTGFLSLNTGIHAASITGTVNGTMSLKSQLMDAGTQQRYKVWDYAMFEGTLSGQVRFGYTDSISLGSVIWGPWNTLEKNVPLLPRESIFLAMEIEATNDCKLAGISIFGALTGLTL